MKNNVPCGEANLKDQIVAPRTEIVPVPRESIQFEGDTPCCLCGLAIPPEPYLYTCSKHEAGGWCFSAADRDKPPPIKLIPKGSLEPVTGVYIDGQCYIVPCWAFDLGWSLAVAEPLKGTSFLSPYVFAKALSEAWLKGFEANGKELLATINKAREVLDRTRESQDCDCERSSSLPEPIEIPGHVISMHEEDLHKYYKNLCEIVVSARKILEDGK